MLNCSDASRGSSVGKWSIDITNRGATPSLDTLSTARSRVGRPIKHLLELDRHGRIREGGIDTIDGYRIERIGGVTADIHNDGQPSRLAGRVDLFFCEERRDGRREVDAIDEDVDVEDLSEWAALGRLRQIPLEDVISEATIVGVNPCHHPPTHALTRRDQSCEGDRQHRVHIVREHRSRGP